MLTSACALVWKRFAVASVLERLTFLPIMVKPSANNG